VYADKNLFNTEERRQQRVLENRARKGIFDEQGVTAVERWANSYQSPLPTPSLRVSKVFSVMYEAVERLIADR
jgi:hypothetical protein